MSKFKFSLFSTLFRRNEYDPTRFEKINEVWDEKTSGNEQIQNITNTGLYQNKDLLFEQQVNNLMQKLEQYEKTLPDLNDYL